MLISPSFTYLPFWVTAALASSCIREAPAQSLPPPPPPPSLSSCNFLSPQSSLLSKTHPLSNVTLLTDEHGRKFTLFNQTSFVLQTGISFSASFNFTPIYSREEDISYLGLAFILARSPLAKAPSFVQSTEVNFRCEPYPMCLVLGNPFPACSTLPQHDLQIQDPKLSNLADEADYEAPLKHELSFTYLADIAELRMQAVQYGDRLEFKFTFSFSTNSDASNESTITFFVGYITSAESSINLTTTRPTFVSTPAPVITAPTPGTLGSTFGIDDHETHDETHDESNSSKHIKVVAWVLVGIFTMGTLIGLIVLVLLIKKILGECSRPDGHGSPPLTRRAPFSHHDLESSVTPMMMSAPSPPPIHFNAFQMSGTASWLNQPNPR